MDSPLSRLLEDDTVTILEQLIPFCNKPLGKLIALEVKIREIELILNGFEDSLKLSACGFDNDQNNFEDMLRTLKNNVSPEKSTQITQLLNMIQFSKLYQNYLKLSQEHPELVSSAATKKEGPDLASMLADPSILQTLQSLMSLSEKDGNNKLPEILASLFQGKI